VNVAQAVFKCIKAAKDAVSQLSPSPIINCVGNLAKAIAQLLPYVPPLSYVRLVVEILSAIRAILEDLILVIVQIDTQISLIKETLQQGMNTNDSVMIEIGECAKQNVEKYVRGLMETLYVIGSVLGLFVVFLEVMADLLPGDVGRKLEDLSDSIGSAIGSLDSTSVGDYGPLGAIASTVVVLRDAIAAMEEQLCRVVGLEFVPLEIINWNLRNP
jgi:hypothetical protein